MTFITDSGGKLLVHCHAGQGRTAVIIGAYLLYNNITSTVDETIEYTRKNRHKCFKKKYNREYMEVLKKSMDDLKVLFPIDGHLKMSI
jgi:protein-tyrosine phosphatase